MKILTTNKISVCNHYDTMGPRTNNHVECNKFTLDYQLAPKILLKI
jgi:hypothetical protein